MRLTEEALSERKSYVQSGKAMYRADELAILVRGMKEGVGQRTGAEKIQASRYSSSLTFGEFLEMT